MNDVKDKIFDVSGEVKPFEFNSDVAQVFDDMITRSVPLYRQVQTQILGLLSELKPKANVIYDLGCSTGELLFILDQHQNRPDCRYVGVDASAPMIDKACSKQKAYKQSGVIEFCCADVFDGDYGDGDVIILNYVLQFLAPEQRLVFLSRLQKSLKPGSILIVSEKTQSQETQVNSCFTKLYEGFKVSNQYSKLEVAQKRKALENVLTAFSFKENMELFDNAGFTSVTPFATWFNFSSFVAIK